MLGDAAALSACLDEQIAEMRNQGQSSQSALHASRDFYNAVEDSEFAEAEREMSQVFEAVLEKLVPHRGPPRLRTQGPEWYPEAIQLAAWEIPGGLAYLVLDHCDQEVPFVLSLGAVPEQEL
jgi:hypothetical protein